MLVECLAGDSMQNMERDLGGNETPIGNMRVGKSACFSTNKTYVFVTKLFNKFRLCLRFVLETCALH